MCTDAPLASSSNLNGVWRATKVMPELGGRVDFVFCFAFSFPFLTIQHLFLSGFLFSRFSSRFHCSCKCERSSTCEHALHIGLSPYSCINNLSICIFDVHAITPVSNPKAILCQWATATVLLLLCACVCSYFFLFIFLSSIFSSWFLFSSVSFLLHQCAHVSMCSCGCFSFLLVTLAYLSYAC